MLEEHVFSELRVGPGSAVMSKASPDLIFIAKQAKTRGLDISTLEKIFWKVLIRILTLIPAVLVGFVLGLGILIPLIYMNTMKWHDIFFYSLYRRVLAGRLKVMVDADIIRKNETQ